ncbi:MAG: NADH-quinone oxidoreductase subunit NuoE [Bacillota bacterium]
MFKEGGRETIIETINAVLAEHGARRENLIPLLQEVQERLGYLPKPAMEEIASALGVPAVEVYGPATFYNAFRLHPPGDHQIKVCMGTACFMIGGQIALDSFERRLKIKLGETTPDRRFSLDQVACVGCCALAPVVVVDNLVEGHVTPTRVDGIILSFETQQGDGKGEQEA